MARYLITGGTGFLGSALVERVRADGDEVIVAGRHRVEQSRTYDWIDYDLRDDATVANILEARPDGMFHLAWSTTPASAERDVQADARNNLGGTIALLEHLEGKLDVPIVFVSSGGTVYGHAETLPIAETHPLRPIGFYGQTKVSAETYAALFRGRGGLDVRIARVSNPYGANQSSAKLQGAATVFARRILAEEPITIWGDGSIVRDYVHINDVANGLIRILKLPRSADSAPPIYNVASGIGTSLNELIEAVAQAAGRRPVALYQPHRVFDVPSNVLDIAKLSAAADWRPRYSLSEGLRELVASLRGV